MKQILLWTAVAVGVLAGLFAFDRLALWMESRGWLYWRRTRRRTGTGLADAFLEVQSLIEPRTRHVVEERRAQKPDLAESGDPPGPSGR